MQGVFRTVIERGLSRGENSKNRTESQKEQERIWMMEIEKRKKNDSKNCEKYMIQGTELRAVQGERRTN